MKSPELTIEWLEKFIGRQYADRSPNQEAVVVAKQLLATMRREAKLRDALVNARHILRVENMLQKWPENTKIIDEALQCEYSDV
jgi:hypothetical protein